MKPISLADQADHFRALVERLDRGNNRAKARLLPAAIEQAERLAAELLDAGGADPSPKSEIIAWVIRFRNEKNRLHTSRPAPITHTFDYDTSDPRTKDPAFVKTSAAERRAKLAKRRTNFGVDESAMNFALNLAKVRKDVDEAVANDPIDTQKLVDRLAELSNTLKTAIHRRFHQEVRNELDLLALHLCGVRLREAAHPLQKTSKAVPDEIRPIFGKQIVSGGLPTLGRNRR